jgi:hypothetical protein
VTVSVGGVPKNIGEIHEDEVMAQLSKMLKDGNNPYSLSRPSSKVVGGFPVPQAPEPPPSRMSLGRNNSKRMTGTYAAMGMGGGIPRAPVAPPNLNDLYRPDGGRFG